MACRDNVVILSTVAADLYDSDARLLAKFKKIFILNELTFDRDRIFPSETAGKYLIVLSVKERQPSLSPVLPSSSLLFLLTPFFLFINYHAIQRATVMLLETY